jgi:hypothetical protein
MSRPDYVVDVRVRGDEDLCRQVTAALTAAPPYNWNWLGTEVRYGAGEVLYTDWHLGCTGYPHGLAEVSLLWPVHLEVTTNVVMEPEDPPSRFTLWDGHERALAEGEEADPAKDREEAERRDHEAFLRDLDQAEQEGGAQ